MTSSERHPVLGAEAEATPEPTAGDRIGPYRLVRLLGAGATGRVFEVEHERLGRRAAMKTLAGGHAKHPSAIRRLFTEARAINRISNPHIVEVTDLVEGGEHDPAQAARGATPLPPVNAIVMELLEGQSLARVMVEEGPLEPDRFLVLLAQVCRALAAAHTAGFVHRDLKPENIFLIDGGRGRHEEDFVKLLDFGLTKALGTEPSLTETPPSATLDGVFVGTPAYVSPEQASGRAVDARSDIYAIGVILFELICGHLPFEGPSVGEFLIQHVTAPPPHLPDDVRATKLGAMLDAIVQRCLEKDPAARFPAAAQLARMFDDLARGGDVAFSGFSSYLAAARRSEAVPLAGREVGRAAVGLGIGLALALATGVALPHLRRPDRAAMPTSARLTLAAPHPAPAPEGAAPQPTSHSEVTLSFESEPPGAVVRVAGGGEPLGITPLQKTVARRGEVLLFEISRAGYDSMRVPTPATSSRVINVTLTRTVPPRREKTPASPARPLGAGR